MTSFFAANLDLVYLLYGLAFIALGLVLWLQLRTPISPGDTGSLWLLAGFALLHGFAEWAQLGALLRSGAGQDAAAGVFAHAAVTLTAVSFVLLLQFGVESLSQDTPFGRWLRFVPLALVAVVALLLFVGPGFSGPVGASSWFASAEAIFRYLFGLPGTVLTAIALGSAARRLPPGARRRPYMMGAAVSFAVYAPLTGLIVPPGPLPSAAILNSAWFLETFGFPVQVGRTICALAATGFLAEAFVIEATREYVRRREELDQLKDEFISMASHELRAPLAPLKGYAQVLQQRAKADPARADELMPLESIIAQVARLTALIERLLDVARLRAGRMELKHEPMDIVVLARRLVEQTQLTNPKHRLTLVAKKPRVVGTWDQSRLEEVLANLLDNAVKYSPEGGPIEVAVDTTDGRAEVAVRDHGVGIPKEAQAQIFGRFYRVRAGGPRPPGMGLGLYISQQIVLLHGGRMWFESEEGRGSSFYFSLPLGR